MKIKKHIWLPSLLLIYLGIMAYVWRDTITERHEYVRYFSTIGVEFVIIALLVIFLRKREILRKEREDDIRNSQNEKR
jgi:hypothetical protein